MLKAERGNKPLEGMSAARSAVVKGKRPQRILYKNLSEKQKQKAERK